MIHGTFACLLAILLLFAATQEANSHAVINEGTAVAGSFSFITPRITHGVGPVPDGYYGEFQEPSAFIRIVEKLHGDEHR